jgi:menaquinone-dependent protoporphyrinogen oxidase
MKLLVAAASRHGSTQEIATTIVAHLQESGFDSVYHDIAEVSTLADYDAVVLGSAVYMGNWLREARRFVDRHQAALASRPVWLFSSGPLGSDTGRPAMTSEVVDGLVNTVQARDHQTFAGKLERTSLSPGERLIVRIVRAPTGDYRDWEAIQRWSAQIASALTGSALTVAPVDYQLVDSLIHAL